MTAGGREHSPEWFIHSRRAPQECSRPAGIFARPFGIIRGWRESSQPRFGIPPAGGDIPGLWRGHSRLARGYPRQRGGHSLHSQRGRYNAARRHAGTVKTCGHPLLSGPPTLNDIHQIFKVQTPVGKDNPQQRVVVFTNNDVAHGRRIARRAPRSQLSPELCGVGSVCAGLR